MDRDERNDEDDAGYICYRDIRYRTASKRCGDHGEKEEGDRQLLDVYVPTPKNECRALKNKRPVVVYVHGGAWMCNDKDNDKVRAVARQFVELGYVVCTPTYRLSPLPTGSLLTCVAVGAVLLLLGRLAPCRREQVIWTLCGFVFFLLALLFFFVTSASDAQFPDHLDDCVAAFDWMRANASRFGADAQRTVLVGHSAGAHLASLVAIDRRPHVAALVVLSGVYDATLVCSNAITRLFAKTIFGPDTDDVWRRKAFPLERIVEGGFPPTFVGTAEFEIGLKEHAFRLVQRLAEMDIPFCQKSYVGTTHLNIATKWDSANRHILADINAFLFRHLY